ncbi:MAG: hypothetical protein QNK19_08915 [Xanthomonadales bacterium]|nr:hypothetical protein [Xanthomonadales bacterium]
MPCYSFTNFFASRLPSYMLPRRIIRLDSMPLNASGKIDRNAIVALLDQDVAQGMSHKGRRTR